MSAFPWAPLDSVWPAVNGWLLTYIIYFLYRYTRLVVNAASHWAYKSKPLPLKPKYTKDDVTVVIPTIHNVPEELRTSLESILACEPHKLILVTTDDKFAALEALVQSLSAPDTVEVLCGSVANKRLQLCEALPDVKTAITIMADDDVWWPSTLLPWLLAPFEDPDMGAVGSCQRVRRERDGSISSRLWNWLGTAYIERRNFEISATHNLDGGTSCMSGRTGAYRTTILSSSLFLAGFKTERWGKYILNADDDNYVTRWLVNHGWKTWIQYNDECEIETTLENGVKYLFQCARWARSNWRSNYTSLFVERTVLRRQPWCTYALHAATFTSLAFLLDPLLLCFLWWGTTDWNQDKRRQMLYANLVWMFAFTKVVKLIGLFRRNPRDLVYLPVSIAFGYFHGLIKLYALFTLNMTSWGSRPDGDLNDNERMFPVPRPSDFTETPAEREDDLDKRLRNPSMTLAEQRRSLYLAREKAALIAAEEPPLSLASSEKQRLATDP